MRYSLDPSVRRVGEGRVLIGGSPLKLFGITDRGAQLIDSIERGEVVENSPAANALVNRLLDAGALHPDFVTSEFDADSSASPLATQITLIVPAFDSSAATLDRLVAQISLGTDPGIVAVIIVDDGSRPPISEVTGATVVRRSTNGGPAAARSTGLEHVATPLVAFVDTDVELAPNWLRPLLAHFADPRVALVAPRVASVEGTTVLARYEMLHSPLDLGSVPARVRAGTRVSYVPTAAVVCRVIALRDVGGFDDSMRVGEDVDLAWRLDETGWRVRYEPAVTVTHRPRTSFAAWAKQRRDYGTSAAPLATRHPGSLAPVRVSGWSAATWFAIAAGWPIVGGIIAAVTTAMLSRKLRNIPDGKREALRLAGLGHLFAGRSLASALTRAWWPLATIAALVSRRARRAVLIAAIAPATIDWIRLRPQIDPLRYIGLRLLDDMSYGIGLAHGAVQARSIQTYIPDFTSWPRAKSTRGEISDHSNGPTTNRT